MSTISTSIVSIPVIGTPHIGPNSKPEIRKFIPVNIGFFSDGVSGWFV